MKVKEQAAALEVRGPGGTDSAGRRDTAPEFCGKREMGREAQLWVYSARSYVEAVNLPATNYGAFKLTSRFRDDAISWQINSG